MSEGQSITRSIKFKNFFNVSVFVLAAVICIGLGFYYLKFDPNVDLQKRIETEKSFLDPDGSFHYRSTVRVPTNPGLPRFLIPVRNELLRKNVNANLIFLLVRNPDSENTWDNFEILKKQFFSKIAKKETIDLGHLQWGWSCDINGQRIEGASGYGGEQRNQLLNLALSGWGVTSALMALNDGYFEPPWAVEVSHRQTKSEQTKMLTVITNSSSCEKFLNAYENLRFKNRLNKFNLFENLDISDDTQISSANCATVSDILFSKIEKFPNEIFKKSQTTINIPFHFFGFPNEKLPSDIELPQAWRDHLKARSGISVQWQDILLTGQDSNQSVPLNFLDPQKIFRSLSDYPKILDLQ